MLIHEGHERTAAIDLKLAGSLAAVAGAINAAGFQATGFFTANMTGNVSSLADQVGLSNYALAAAFLALVVSFVAGAFCSGVLIEIGRSRQIRGIYAYSILVEALLLLAFAVADFALPIDQSRPILVFGLSFIMGLQNAATTRISNARVRTTHVSGMATDLGLNLAALTSSGRDQDEVRSRLVLHLSTLGSFLLGGIVGVLSYLVIGAFVFVLAATVLLVIALPELRRSKS
ncbi:YoaK family protein [Devosia riboflavina]